MDENELLQFSISFPAAAYPDELDQAKTTVLAMLREELADVLEQNHDTPRKREAT